MVEHGAAGLIILGSLITVRWIGKPRTPITPGIAATALALNAFFVYAIYH